MTSPFFHEQNLAPAQNAGTAGLGSGPKELAFNGVSAGTETGLGMAGGAPLNGQEVAAAAAAKASAEASALSGKVLLGKTAVAGTAAIGQGAVGNAVLGHSPMTNPGLGQLSIGNAAIGQAGIAHAAVGNAAIAHAALAPSMLAASSEVSPLVQLIMRMPGAMGVANSFFEWLFHMFAPGGHDLMGALSSLHLDMELAGHVASLQHLTGLLEAGEHFSISLTSLPMNAPIMQGLQHAGAQLGGIDRALNVGGLSDHFLTNPGNIGAGADLGHAQFEQAAAGSVDGALSGPAVSSAGSQGFLAGNQRMFSDSLAGGGQFNSITSNTSVPVAGSAANNATSGTMAQQVAQMQSRPTSVGPASTDSGMAETARVAPTENGIGAGQGTALSAQTDAAQQSLGPSSFGQRFADKNLIASESPAYRPSTANYQGGQSGQSDVTPLKAHQLTFEEVRKGVVGGHGKQLIDHIAGKQSPSSLQHPAFQSRFGSPRIASTTGLSSHATGAVSPRDAAAHHAAAAPKIEAQAQVQAHFHSQPQNLSHAHASEQAVHATGSSHDLAKSNSQPGHLAHAKAKLQDHKPAAPKAADGKHSSASDAALKGSGADQAGTAQSAQVAQTSHVPSAYTVQRGDSLWNIAQKQFGDGSRWTDIYKMNSDLLGHHPDMIFSGTQLKLPGADQLVGDATKYVVKPGDNLWSIAKGHMGSAAKWSDIYKANMGTIGGNPSLIQPGQQLSLPGANANPPSVVQMPSAASTNTLAAASPSSSIGGMDISQPMQTAPQMSLPHPGGLEQQIVPAAHMPAPSGALEHGMAEAADKVMKASPALALGAGNGQAGAVAAATLHSPSVGVVANSLKPDLSLLDK